MKTRANILIAAVQVPFTEGGAELLVKSLQRELKNRDFKVDIVQLPFSAEPKKDILRQIELWRALDLSSFAGHQVDLVIATKFPSYMLQHPCKVTWLIHQHRQIYDLYGSRFGDFEPDIESESLRQLIVEADQQAFSECKACYTISTNVSNRVERYLNLEAPALPPPLPLGDSYQSASNGGYILSVGRICSIKRVDMMIKAMSQVVDGVKLKIVGLPDEPAHEDYLKNEIDKHHLWEKVEFLGRVPEQELIKLFSEALAVYYAPFDEDYGFVTLEALASAVPVITCQDSGGVLAYIQDGVNGLVTEANEYALAAAVNRLKEEPGLREKLVENSSLSLTEKICSWDEVISALTAPIC